MSELFDCILNWVAWSWARPSACGSRIGFDSRTSRRPPRTSAPSFAWMAASALAAAAAQHASPVTRPTRARHPTPAARAVVAKRRFAPPDRLGRLWRAHLDLALARLGPSARLRWWRRRSPARRRRAARCAGWWAREPRASAPDSRAAARARKAAQELRGGRCASRSRARRVGRPVPARATAAYARQAPRCRRPTADEAAWRDPRRRAASAPPGWRAARRRAASRRWRSATSSAASTARAAADVYALCTDRLAAPSSPRALGTAFGAPIRARWLQRRAADGPRASTTPPRGRWSPNDGRRREAARGAVRDARGRTRAATSRRASGGCRAVLGSGGCTAA